MDKFCLKWNDFEANIRESFRELREDQNHFDVTLASDDDHQVQAHKIILSAGSHFFSNILTKTKHPSPFLYLKGITGVELEYVIEFLYNGEVNIAQEELTRFLETAQELQVKGLINHENENNHETIDESSIMEINSKSDNLQHGNNTESILDSLQELADTFDNKELSVVERQEVYEGNKTTELDFQIELMLEKNEGIWKCKVCGKMTNKKANLRMHAETHIEGGVHTCHICDKVTTARHKLQTHIHNFHSGLSLTCNICSKSWESRKSFNKHNRVHHKTKKPL